MKRFRQISVEELRKMIPMVTKMLVLDENGDEWFWLNDYISETILDRFADAMILIEEPEEDVQADDDKPQKDERWVPTEVSCWRVGDEVEDIDDRTTFVISAIDEDGDIRILKKSGYSDYISKCSKSYYRKTGRHFPQIKEVLDLLKEGGAE